jgi:hypothetical protein
MGWGFNPAIERRLADPRATPAIEALQGATRDGGRVTGVGLEVLEPNSALRWGLRDARGHEQPAVGRFTALWYATGGGATVSTEAVNPFEPRTAALLDVLGVRALLFPPDAFPAGSRTGTGPFDSDRVVHRGEDGIVLERDSALPEAYVAYGWRRSDGPGAAPLTASGGRDAALEAPVLETAQAPASTAAGPATPARVVSRTDTEVVVEADARAAGHLVLLDTYYPGWRAEVDGREAPILAANAAFRAVALEPGRHRVRFTYAPGSVRAGVAISLAALVALLIAAAVAARGRGRARTGHRARPRARARRRS